MVVQMPDCPTGYAQYRRRTSRGAPFYRLAQQVFELHDIGPGLEKCDNATVGYWGRELTRNINHLYLHQDRQQALYNDLCYEFVRLNLSSITRQGTTSMFGILSSFNRPQSQTPGQRQIEGLLVSSSPRVSEDTGVSAGQAQTEQQVHADDSDAASYQSHLQLRTGILPRTSTPTL